MISVVAVFGLGYLWYSFNALPQNAPHEITVSGDGRAYAKPDVALIIFGAHTEAIKSQDAVSQNNTIMNAVTAAAKGLGVADKDIQTVGYDLQPKYNYTQNGGQVFVGYSLDQKIQVKIRNFDNINAILDGATKNGANTTGSLQFTVDDMEKVKSEARADAIKQAKEKASSMFDAAGLSGAKIVNISEGYNNYPQPMYATGLASPMAKDSVAPSIQTGQQEVDVTVTLTYRIK